MVENYAVVVLLVDYLTAVSMLLTTPSYPLALSIHEITYPGKSVEKRWPDLRASIAAWRWINANVFSKTSSRSWSFIIT